MKYNNNLPEGINAALDMMFGETEPAPVKTDAPAGRIYTRDDIVRILSDKVEATAAQWGENYIYTRWAKDKMTSDLAKYDAGKVIPVETETYIENSTEYEKVYMSDGTVKTVNYGYID